MLKIIRNNRLKFLSILSTFYIILVLCIIINVGVSEGYEISIYQTYPIYFWFLIIGLFLVGIFYCLHVCLKIKYLDKYFLLIPIFTILFTSMLLIFLPFIRGYAIFGRVDVLSHIGLMKDILNTGQFNNNWYPILHIFGVQFSKITTINIEIVTMIFPVIFYLFYIIGIFYMGKELFGKKIGFIIFLISFIPLFGPSTTFFAPSTLGLFILPFLMYMFLKSIKDERYSLLYIISMFSFVIFHPLRGLFFIVIIAIILFTVTLYDNLNKNPSGKSSNSSFNNESYGGSNLEQRPWFCLPRGQKQRHFWRGQKILKNFYSFKKISIWLRLILLSSIIWSTWYILYEPYHRALWSVQGLFLSFFESNYQVYGDIVQDFSTPLFYALRVGIFRLGSLGIMTILVLFFIFIFISQKKGFKKRFESKMQTTLMIFLFSFFSVITFLFFLIGSPGGYGRYLSYVIIFSTFLVGLLFYLIYTDIKSIINKYHISKFIYFLFAIMVILSIFSLYDSPIRGTDNHQVTRMELIGMEWMFEHRNHNLTIEELQGTSQYRFYSAIYGDRDYGKNIRYKMNQIVDPHFGYDDNDTLGDQYEANAYLVISKINRIRYQELYPGWEEAQFFTNEDFKKFEFDKTVNSIYRNAEFDGYFIKSGDKL